MEGALSKALCSLSSMGRFPHVQCVHSWLAVLFWGPCEYACAKSQAWLPTWERTSKLVSSSISQEGPSSTLHPPSGIVAVASSPGATRLCELQSRQICFSVTKTDFSLGFIILFQTKKYTQETVWQYFPPFKSGGQSQGCTSRFW